MPRLPSQGEIQTMWDVHFREAFPHYDENRDPREYFAQLELLTGCEIAGEWRDKIVVVCRSFNGMMERPATRDQYAEARHCVKLMRIAVSDLAEAYKAWRDDGMKLTDTRHEEALQLLRNEVAAAVSTFEENEREFDFLAGGPFMQDRMSDVGGILSEARTLPASPIGRLPFWWNTIFPLNGRSMFRYMLRGNIVPIDDFEEYWRLRSEPADVQEVITALEHLVEKLASFEREWSPELGHKVGPPTNLSIHALIANLAGIWEQITRRRPTAGWNNASGVPSGDFGRFLIAVYRSLPKNAALVNSDQALLRLAHRLIRRAKN